MPAGDRLVPAGDPSDEILVVGAGLAGLSAARHLEAAGRRVTVLEAGDAVGGRMRTDRPDGWLLDRGFQVFDTGYPEPRRLLTPADRTGLDLKPLPNAALVRVGNDFHRVGDPRQRPASLPATARAPISGVKDKVALGALLFRIWTTRGDRLLDRPERSAYDAFRAAGLSDTVIDRLLRPFLAGVLLEDELSTSSRYVELVLHAFSRGRQTLPAGGAGELPHTIAAPLDDVRLNTPVERICSGAVMIDGQELRARAVIVATDPAAAARLLGDRVPAAPMRSVSTLYYAADESPGSTGGALCIGAGPLTNAVVLTDTLASYSPDGRSLISASTLHTGMPDDAVREVLVDWFGPAAAGWEQLHRYDIPEALPSADPPLGRLRKPVRLEPGLYVCGDHRDSPSQQGALVSGRRAARAALNDLETTTR